MDFGATRGFDQSFTDVYIEVRAVVLASFIFLIMDHKMFVIVGNPLGR